jgi:hypothetical protein
MAGANWEDRLTPQASTAPASNWEDRLRASSVTPIDPTDGMSTFDLLAAGVGRGMTNFARGVGQKLNMVSADDIKEARRLDGPLMGTTPGKIGDFVGNAALAAPAMMIPGAGTYAGAAGIGAGIGALAPAESLGEWGGNTLLGGVGGAVGNVAGRLLGAGYGLAKSTIAPFFDAGQKAMARDAISRFTPDISGTIALLRANGRELVPGSLPTAAEASGRPGLAQLAKQAQNEPAVAEMFQQRARDQAAARVAALREVAGDPGKRAFFEADRSAVADAMYGNARKAGIDPAALTPQAQANIAAFQQRLPPQVLDHARELAKISGTPMTDATSLDGMHWTKRALDSMISRESGPNGSPEMLRALSGLKSDLLTGMDNLSPAYAQARQTFADMSKPINQMDVGQALFNKAVPALNDFGAHGNLKAAGFADALRHGDAVAQRVLGMPRASIGDVLDNGHMATLNNVAQDLARTADARMAASTPGSDTVKNLVSQGILRNTLGPLGLPASAATNTLMATLLRPAQFAGAYAEPKVMGKIGEALLDPQATIQMLQAAQRAAGPTRAKALAEALRRQIGTMGATSAIGAFSPVSPALTQ